MKIERPRNWSNFPEFTPKESGYYYTYYYNKTLNEHLYKAIFWDCINNVWIFPTYDFMVEKFSEETWSRYYSDCLRKTVATQSNYS